MISDTPPTFRLPDWMPLQRVLVAEFGAAAIDAAASFWFIGFVAGPDDVGELRLYEHSMTRRRLTLDHDGGAYRWFDEIGGYSRIPTDEALVEALV